MTFLFQVRKNEVQGVVYLLKVTEPVMSWNTTGTEIRVN